MKHPHLSQSQQKTVTQFLRYALVGVMNTVLTLIVILICKSILGINPWISNALGYIIGFVNSFLWNKLWVFNSQNRVITEAMRFCLGFLVCYAIQLLATWMLNTLTPLDDWQWTVGRFTISGYGVATLLGMCVYTLANYIFNRKVTFK